MAEIVTPSEVESRIRRPPAIQQLLPAAGWFAEEVVEKGPRETKLYRLVAWALLAGPRFDGDLGVVGLITYDGDVDFPDDDCLVRYVYRPDLIDADR